MSEPLLCYRAGPTALARLREAPLESQVRVWVGPATGPKWLALYGLDIALLAAGVLGRTGGPVLAGASAGAWRAVSLASPRPESTHAALRDAYCDQTFGRDATPEAVSAAYRDTLQKTFGGMEGAIAAGARHELVIHTTRVRGSDDRPERARHATTLALAAVLAPLARGAQRAALERVSFATPGADAVLERRHGRRVPLSSENLLPATLASGTVPLAMQPVRAIPGAPPGAHVDGGLTDYHLADGYAHADGVTLLLSHQGQIVERWLDRFAPWRRIGTRLLDAVVHIYPSPAFLARLPEGRVPEREDFTTWMDRPTERMAFWRRAAAESHALGEELLADLRSGAFGAKLLPFASHSRR